MKGRTSSAPVSSRTIVGLAALIAVLAVMGPLMLRVSALLGAYTCAAAILLLVFLALTVARLSRLALIAAVLPLAYWLTLGLSQRSAPVGTLCLYVSLLLLGLLYGHVFKGVRPRFKLRLRPDQVADVPLAVLAGIALGTLTYMLLPGEAALAGQPALWMVPQLALLYASVEVFYFQGLFQANVRQVLPQSGAVICAAILFAGVCAHPSAAGWICAAIQGVVFAGIYFLTSHLAHVTITNAATKLTFVALFAIFH